MNENEPRRSHPTPALRPSTLPAAQRARALARALQDKRAVDVTVLDLSRAGAFTDFFVIATGTSDRHLRALAEAVHGCARRLGERRLGIEGERSARWALVDLGDVVIHLFSREAREYYAIERLWGEAVEVAAEPLQGQATGTASA